MSRYSLFNKTIEYSRAEENGIILYNDLEKKLKATEQSFKNWYKKCGNIESVLKGYKDFAISTLEKYALNSLFNNFATFDIYCYTERSYLKNHINTDFIDEYLDDVEYEYAVIIYGEEVKKQYRKQRKKERPKMVGYGFDLASTIDRSIQAGIYNATTGVAHSILNTAGNTSTAISASLSKFSLYNNDKTKSDVNFQIEYKK